MTNGTTPQRGVSSLPCDLISVAVAIDDHQPYNLALSILDPAMLADRSWKAHDVVAEVDAGLASTNEQLARVEQIQRFEILDGEWQPGSDEITPTMKLTGKQIAHKCASVIDENARHDC